MSRIAIFSDVHGNAAALDAVRKAIKAARPDAIIVAGDHALNGPEPANAIDGIRELEADGALVVQGNTDIAVADFDYGAAFPWLTDGVPDSFRAVAEWTHEAIGPERVDWLRRLPAERRIRLDDTLVIGCHGSPGSQTQGFDLALDPSVTIERAARTDARIIACGHTHMPGIRDLGFKLIVNGGSAGFVFDGDPTASWALVDLDAASGAGDGNGRRDDDEEDEDGGDRPDDGARARPRAEIHRAAFDVMSVANAISSRGLPGDVYRAATVRTGKLVR